MALVDDVVAWRWSQVVAGGETSSPDLYQVVITEDGGRAEGAMVVVVAKSATADTGNGVVGSATVGRAVLESGEAWFSGGWLS